MNKIQQNRLWVIVAIAGLMGMGSCNNDSGLELLTERQEEIKAINPGRETDGQRWLIFKDIAEFENTVSKLAGIDDKKSLAKWAEQNKGFISWAAISERDTVKSKQIQKIDLPDPLLSTILNKEGRVQIADTIYQLDVLKEKPVLFAVPSKFESLLLKGESPTGIRQVTVHSIGLTLMPFFPRWEETGKVSFPEPNMEICNFPGGSIFPWWGQKGDLIYTADNGSTLPKDNGRQVRIDYHRWRVGFIFYSSAGIRVKIQKDTRLGGWMSTINMNSVSMQSCIRGDVLIPGLPTIPFHEQVAVSSANTNKIEKTLKWAAAPFHVEVLPRNFNFKFSVNYKGQQVSRFIRE